METLENTATSPASPSRGGALFWAAVFMLMLALAIVAGAGTLAMVADTIYEAIPMEGE